MLALTALAILTPVAHLDRRAVLKFGAAAGTAFGGAARPAAAAQAGIAQTLDMKLSSSGMKWADLRQGTGGTPVAGQRVLIDYMMTRRAGSKIYSTVDSKKPFEWTLGDGTVIEGLELAILGGGDLPPLQQGGARRVIIPQNLAYGKDKGFFSGGAPTEIRNLGPVPPDFEWIDQNGDKVSSYLRFKNIYLDENRLDQPDLILDISLRAMKGAQAQAAAEPAPAAQAMTAPPPAEPAAPAAPELPAPAAPPAMATASPSEAQIEQLRLQLETQKKELALLQAAEANYRKYGYENGRP